MPEPIDLLARPVYGMAQVDWNLRLPPGTARRWIDGYTRGGKKYPPIVRLQSTGDEIVTWGEFTETRHLSEYRRDGISMAKMRPAVERLRDLFNTQYPLAAARPWLQEQGRELVLSMQEEVGLEKHLLLVVVRNNQLALSLQTRQFIDSVDFGRSQYVERMHPLPELDQVWFDPRRQFGEPVVRSVPTSIIAEQARAGDHLDTIADLYELTGEEVWQAIRYELLRGGDAPQAA